MRKHLVNINRFFFPTWEFSCAHDNIPRWCLTERKYTFVGTALYGYKRSCTYRCCCCCCCSHLSSTALVFPLSLSLSLFPTYKPLVNQLGLLATPALNFTNDTSVGLFSPGNHYNTTSIPIRWWSEVKFASSRKVLHLIGCASVMI